MATFGDSTVDMVTGSVANGERSGSLTDLELRVLDYFDARRGQLVTRRELEREVWGFRAGVRSEAVPVAIRRLRSKIGSEAIRTVYGQGWRVGPSARTSPARTAPIAWPTRPLFGRRRELARVRERLASRQAVLLTGPAGVGKTHLAVEVARTWSGEVVQVAVDGVEQAAVVALLADALGCSEARPDTVRTALSTRSNPLVVLDGADGLDADLVVSMLDGAVTLLTSRRWTVGSTVAVVHVEPFSTDEAREFLVLRLSEVLPEPDAEDAVLDALVAAVDGLPGALEVLAAQALFGVAPVLERLEHGGLSDDLTASIDRSWAVLTDTAQQALLVCSGFGGLFPREAAIELCGALSLATLRASSLLHQGQDGLYVLEVVRAFCKQQTGADIARGRSHQWVVERAERWSRTAYTQPGRAIDEVRRLRRQLVEVAAQGTPERSARAVCSLATTVDLTGPHALVEPLLRAVSERAPPEPWLDRVQIHLLRAQHSLGRSPSLVVADLVAFEGAEAELCRGMALGADGQLAAAAEALRRSIALAPTDWTGPFALARLTSVVFKDYVDDPRALLEQALAVARRERLLWCEAYVLTRMASVVARTDGLEAARPHFATVLTLTEEQHLHRIAVDAWNLFGIALLTHDLSASHATFCRAVDVCLQIGVDPVRHSCALNAAVTALLLDRPERTLELIDVSRTGQFPMLHAFALAVCGAALLAVGRTEEGLANLALCDPTALGRALGQTAAFARQVVRVLRAEDPLRKLPDASAERVIRETITTALPFVTDDENGLFEVLVRRLQERVQPNDWPESSAD